MMNHIEQLTAKVDSLIHGSPGTMDAAKFLSEQHREVEALFAKIEKLERGAVQTRAKLFHELAHKIEGHAQIEEQIFYPAGKSVDKDITLEAFEEHAMVRAMIARLHEIPADDETFLAKVTVLKEMIEHHVKEEEGEYFPEVREALGEERMVELGAELKAAFDRYLTRPVAVKAPAKRAAATKKTRAKTPAAKPAKAKAKRTVAAKAKPAKAARGRPASKSKATRRRAK